MGQLRRYKSSIKETVGLEQIGSLFNGPYVYIVVRALYFSPVSSALHQLPSQAIVSIVHLLLFGPPFAHDSLQ